MGEQTESKSDCSVGITDGHEEIDESHGHNVIFPGHEAVLAQYLNVWP